MMSSDSFNVDKVLLLLLKSYIYMSLYIYASSLKEETH